MSWTNCLLDFCGIKTGWRRKPQNDEEWKVLIIYKIFKIQFQRRGSTQNSVHLTSDMILFHVIDSLCHLFPPYSSIFGGAQEAASVIDEPGVHFFLHAAGYPRVQAPQNINGPHLLKTCPALMSCLRGLFLMFDQRHLAKALLQFLLK